MEGMSHNNDFSIKINDKSFTVSRDLNDGVETAKTVSVARVLP